MYNQAATHPSSSEINMRRFPSLRFVTGLTLGAATSGGLLWLKRGQTRRAALADRIEPVTQQALAQLGVAAEARFITVNGLYYGAVSTFGGRYAYIDLNGPKNAPCV